MNRSNLAFCPLEIIISLMVFKDEGPKGVERNKLAIEFGWKERGRHHGTNLMRYEKPQGVRAPDCLEPLLKFYLSNNIRLTGTSHTA